MRLYVDTCVLVAALTHELESGKVQAWLQLQDPENLLISDWTMASVALGTLAVLL